MSFRPPFPSNNVFPPRHIFPSSNNSIVCKSDGNQMNSQNNFVNCRNMNPCNFNGIPSLTPPNSFHNDVFGPRQPPINSSPLPFPNSHGAFPNNAISSNQYPPNVNAPFNSYFSNYSLEQNQKRDPLINFGANSSNYFGNQNNVSNQHFRYPPQNSSSYNSSVSNFQGCQSSVSQGIPVNISTNYNSFPSNLLPPVAGTSNAMTPALNNSVQAADIMNNHATVSVNSSISFISPPPVSSLSQSPLPQWKNNSFYIVPPPILENNVLSTPFSSNILNPVSEKEIKLLNLSNFVEKFSASDKKNEDRLIIPEFRSVLKTVFSLMKLLHEKKSKLNCLIDASENEWNSEMQSVNDLQKQLSEMCTFITSVHLNKVLKKLKYIKRKRDQKKKTKLNKLSEKIKAEQRRKELHQEIDKWLDNIKEKNSKLKREVEMKKEADFILLEVRRKIQEANRTIEKIKVCEKLRNIRQESAAQKGLHILPEHNENFEKKVSILKKTMIKQLADYEAEEKALKVMLEIEQEGQLKEKTQWELKKLKTRLQKRQNLINECLFGISENPQSTDPLYLFHKYHTSADSSVENLIQIRHQWDVYLSEDGESVPQHWVVPVAPSNSFWEKCLISS